MCDSSHKIHWFLCIFLIIFEWILKSLVNFLFDCSIFVYDIEIINGKIFVRRNNDPTQWFEHYTNTFHRGLPAATRMLDFFTIFAPTNAIFC